MHCMRSLMSDVKKNFSYNIIFQIFTIAMPLITAPYLSRILGASGVGIYSYYFTIANYFVYFAMLGVIMALEVLQNLMIKIEIRLFGIYMGFK